MTFKDQFGVRLPSGGLLEEYRAAERKYAVRIGERSLFIRRLFWADCVPFCDIREICAENERVDCPTSEFPFEGNIFRLYFSAGADKPLRVEVDSAVKAERIRDAVAQKAPDAKVVNRVINA